MDPATTPTHLDLKKDRGLTIEWGDGTTSFYSITYLRRMSPSADMKMLRDEIEKNPLTIVNPRGEATGGPVVAAGAEMVGNYAIRIDFSDGHGTGIYSWAYLRQIDPALAKERRSEEREDTAHDADAPPRPGAQP
ncbi:MAG: DUF971 domain-containing protein [Planctomycetota bacterium]|nr:DUF971 domain-containing protein [Planctomycetota bacterium]